MSDIPYTTVTVSGADAFAFLQAQLATDLNAVTTAQSIPSAWCNPKGRVICTPSIIAVENDFALTMPSDIAGPVTQRLQLFRFRSKVEFEQRSDADRGIDEQLALLRAGIVEIGLAQSEKYTPHMLNLDLLNIVSLEKGCYPGQEIVARTHYRGASKRRCLRFAATAPVATGDRVSDGSRDIGEVVNAIGTDLLAVVPVDQAEQRMMIGEITLTRRELPYAVGP